LLKALLVKALQTIAKQNKQKQNAVLITVNQRVAGSSPAGGAESLGKNTGAFVLLNKKE
jgi:hypothetical protein